MPAEPVEILLVEDNDADAELTIRALRKRELANRIHRLRNGAEALEYFFGTAGATPHPRVVMLDIKMPKVDGLEVLRALKTHEDTKAVPVVMLTSSKEDPDLRAAYALGANSYIVKPVDFEKFSSAIGDLGLYWLLLNERPPG